MQPTIILDAGHGGFDSGATHQGRMEKEDTLRLTLLVGNALKAKGFPVVYTRTTDVYQKPAEKAQLGNLSGGDYFVSIHRNSSPQTNQYKGVQTLVYRDAGKPAKLARAVNDELEQLGFKNLGVSVRPELAVLRGTTMPAILIEAGFINSDVDNQLFDEKLNDIAVAIAEGIAEAVGGEDTQGGGTNGGGTNGGGTNGGETNGGEVNGGGSSSEENAGNGNDEGANSYVVQVGLFSRYENAVSLKKKLAQEGYTVKIIPWKDYYAVTVGEKRSLSRAKELAKQLKNGGYDTFIVNRY